MHDFGIGDSAYFTIHHLELYGEPKTDIHGEIVGYTDGRIQLEVPIYGVFNVSPNELKKESSE